jgi:hypothetical protein
VSRWREGGECVGKGWGAWVWRALCLRQAARGACTCWEVASGDCGGGGALRRAAWGVGRRARGRALGKAAVGVGGGEGGGVVAGGGGRLLCGGGRGGGGERRVKPPPACLLAWLGGRGGRGGGGGAGWGAGERVALRPSVVLHLAGVEGRPGGGGQRREGGGWLGGGGAASARAGCGWAATLSTTSTVLAAQRGVGV